MSQKTKENIISGCQSQVWLNARKLDGRVVLTADSDAIMTKGIIAILIRVLSNQKPDNIIGAELSFIEKIGLNDVIERVLDFSDNGDSL